MARTFPVLKLLAFFAGLLVLARFGGAPAAWLAIIGTVLWWLARS